MERTRADRCKDDPKERGQFHSCKKGQGLADQNALYISDSKAQTLIKGGKSGKTLILKLIQSEICENWFQELFLRRSSGIGVQIPKQLVSLDEKYLKRCLELMHINGWKGTPCPLSVNSGSFDYGTLGRRSSLDATDYYALDSPIIDVGTRDLNLSTGYEEIVGSIMESNSMMRILSSPLFQRLGGNDLFEKKRSIPSEYRGSPSRLTSSLTRNPEKGSLGVRNQGYNSDLLQRSPISTTSSTGLSMSSLSPFGSQGMLHVMWDNEIPHFTFTLDDQKEVYAANACKVEVISDRALDYVYSFHLKATDSKLFDNTAVNEPDLIGKMKVSTAFSLSPSNSRIMETEFVLVGANEYHATRETNTFSRNSRRSRKLSKVMDVFKQRSPSFFGGSSAIAEDFIVSEKGLECKTDLSENDFVSNLELAAIVVKDYLQDDDHHQKEKVGGGWGLKFLKNSGVKQNVSSPEVSASMDIIVPAGTHGGPRTKNGGPTSLIERWRSNGNCDCGGWDIGCPLKILKANPRREEDRSSSDAKGDCKSFDIFTEGSSQGTPPLKMVSIRDGLYFISFQPSSLSALQCFSIAVAIIHSQSPGLRPKHVQD